MNHHYINITTESIDMSKVYENLTDPNCGAQLVFTGVVRNNNENKSVAAVHYESFVPLAEKTFINLAHETNEKYPDVKRIALIHRIGTLAVGEISTVVGVATPHRAEAYEASRFLIEQLKLRLPVWKEEHYVDGAQKWLDGVTLE